MYEKFNNYVVVKFTSYLVVNGPMFSKCSVNCDPTKVIHVGNAKMYQKEVYYRLHDVKEKFYSQT